MSKSILIKSIAGVFSIAALSMSLNANANFSLSLNDEEVILACGLGEHEVPECSPQDGETKPEDGPDSLQGPMGNGDGTGSCHNNPWNPDTQSCLVQMSIKLKQKS